MITTKLLKSMYKRNFNHLTKFTFVIWLFLLCNFKVAGQTELTGAFCIYDMTAGCNHGFSYFHIGKLELRSPYSAIIVKGIFPFVNSSNYDTIFGPYIYMQNSDEEKLDFDFYSKGIYRYGTSKMECTAGFSVDVPVFLLAETTGNRNINYPIKLTYDIFNSDSNGVYDKIPFHATF